MVDIMGGDVGMADGLVGVVVVDVVFVVLSVSAGVKLLWSAV